jgi:DNA-binding NarL/FixJ family response regulator
MARSDQNARPTFNRPSEAWRVQRSSNSTPIRAIVADGSALTRADVARALGASAAFDVVAEAADGTSVLDVTLRAQPDVVVCGMELPAVDGLNVLRRVRDALVRTAVFVVSDVDRALTTRAGDQFAHDVSSLVHGGDVIASTNALDESAVELAQSDSSAALGRHFVEAQLATRRRSVLGEPAALLVSEVVTNAVIHAQSRSWVSLREYGPRVRVEVTDTGGGAPVMRPLTPTAIGGRGLHIVDGIADLWGAVSTPRSKTVWFELNGSNGSNNGGNNGGSATSSGRTAQFAASP